MACSKKAKCYTTLGCGISFILLSILLIVGWPYLFNYILKTQLTLHPNSVSYNMWKETPIPMFMDVYLFNWTNSDEVVHSNWTIKPILEELGPYTFTEHHLRVNVTWNQNNTVAFQQIRTWHFVPEKSNGTLDDKVTNLNPIAATVGYFVRHKHYLIRRAIDLLMIEKHVKFTITKTAGELMFDGYDDQLLDLLKSLDVAVIDIPFKKFGWFVERNGSAEYDGTFNMYTGTDDMLKTGMLTRWNGYDQVPFYPGQCGKVSGSTGELFPPIYDATSVLMFASDMCSSAILEREGNVELHGIEGMRYSGTNRTFDNGALFPGQSCFETGEQTPTGVRNVSACRFGAPAFLSFPHFYLADPVFLERIEGLNASEDLHKLYLELEPSTGLPLNVRARAQVNLLIQPINGIGMYKNVLTTFMPMMWFEQRATLTEDLAAQIKILLILPNVGLFTGIGFGALGLLLFFVLSCVTCRREWQGNEGEKLITAESTTSLSVST